MTEALLKEACALLARWHCELRHTARHVTRAEIEDLLNRIKVDAERRKL